MRKQEETKDVEVNETKEKRHMKPEEVERIYLDKMSKQKKNKRKQQDISNAQRIAMQRKLAKKKKKNKKINS